MISGERPFELKVTRLPIGPTHRLLYLFCSSSSVQFKKGNVMATNPPTGDGQRKGAVRKRSQTFNPETKQWVKRDTDTGKFMDVKQDGKPFKGVRKEK
jgi:hypothetical protein